MKFGNIRKKVLNLSQNLKFKLPILLKETKEKIISCGDYLSLKTNKDINGNISYVFKRFFCLLKSHIIFLKIVKKEYLIAFFTSIFVIFLLFVILDNYLIYTVQYVLIFCCLSWFFSKLQKQEYFKYFLLNRNCYNVYCEILFFMFSYTLILFIIHIPLITFAESGFITMFFNVFAVVADAMCFVLLKPKKFFILQISFLLLAMMFLFIIYFSLQINDMIVFKRLCETYLEQSKVVLAIIEVFIIKRLFCEVFNIKTQLSGKIYEE